MPSSSALKRSIGTKRGPVAHLVDSFGGRLVPVVVLADAHRAEGLAEALVAGGLHVAEVTFRTPAAAEAIRRMAEHPDLVVGAGTVVRAEQVDQAADAGADRKSTRLNSSHANISYAVFCLKKKT